MFILLRLSADRSNEGRKLVKVGKALKGQMQKYERVTYFCSRLPAGSIEDSKLREGFKVLKARCKAQTCKKGASSYCA